MIVLDLSATLSCFPSLPSSPPLFPYPATNDNINATTFNSPSADSISRPVGVNICLMDTSVPKMRLNPIKMPPSTR